MIERDITYTKIVTPDLRVEHTVGKRGYMLVRKSLHEPRQSIVVSTLELAALLDACRSIEWQRNEDDTTLDGLTSVDDERERS